MFDREHQLRQFKMGDKLFVQVVAANLTKRQLDYEWVDDGHKKQAGEQAAPIK